MSFIRNCFCLLCIWCVGYVECFNCVIHLLCVFSLQIFDVTFVIAFHAILLYFSIGWDHCIANNPSRLCMRTYFYCIFCSCREFDQSYYNHLTIQFVIITLIEQTRLVSCVHPSLSTSVIYQSLYLLVSREFYILIYSLNITSLIYFEI